MKYMKLTYLLDLSIMRITVRGDRHLLKGTTFGTEQNYFCLMLDLLHCNSIVNPVLDCVCILFIQEALKIKLFHVGFHGHFCHESS